MRFAAPDDYASLLSIPQVEEFTARQISSNGSSIAFGWNRSGQSEIYILSMNPIGEPEQITTGFGTKTSPRFSPDGRFLAFVCDKDGSETYGLWLCDLEKGIHTQLIPNGSGSLQPNIAWSPDGMKLAYCSDESGIFRTYLLDVSAAIQDPPNGLGNLLMDQSGPHWAASFSPDGNWIAVIAEAEGQDFAAYLVSLVETNAPVLLPLSQGGKVLNVPYLAWSPDSCKLVFSSDVSGIYEIGVYDVGSGDICWLHSSMGDKTMPEWSMDGTKLTYILTRGPETWLGIQSIIQGEPKLFQVGRGGHSAPYFLPDGDKVVFSYSSPILPNDLWILNLSTGCFQQLTHSLPPGQKFFDGCEPDHVTYPSLDGQSVPALLFIPPGFEDPAPAVIVLHGGPNWLYKFTWMPFFQHLVRRGWVVLAPNYRGSSGYGRTWQQANIMDMGGGDAEDVLAGTDFLIRMGLVDPKRIVVTGRSYGGYLTLVCLTRFPHRWAGGVAVAPFVNWFTCHAQARADLQHWDIQTMGSPETYEELWHQRSPYFVLERIQSPVQLIAGENDIRCPVSQSTAARDKLLALGKPVECLIYPDEGHVFFQKDNIIDSELRRVNFLAGILG